jgi:small-conductance mechanosensitive channel
MTLTRLEFLGNDARLWAVAGGIFAGIIVLVWFVRLLLGKRLARAYETETDVDDFALALVRKTKLWLVALPALFFAVRALTLPQDLAAGIRAAAVVALLIQAGLWSNELVDFWLRRYQRSKLESDPSSITTIRAFGFAIDVAIWAVIVLVAVENLGFDVTALVAGLGIGGVAVALATQNILGDLFASLSIVIDKPFVVGDQIMVGTDAGTVEHIGLKTTRVRAISGEQLIFSNADLLRSRLRNMKRMEERRVLFRFGVEYDTTPEKLERIPLIVQSLVEKHEKARFERAHLEMLGDSALEYEAVYWVKTPDHQDHVEIQQKLNVDLLRAFREEEIVFAYPTRTIRLRGESGAE